jgi:phage terminase small subunit
MSKPARAPTGLSASARGIWRSTLERFPFRLTELALLESALRALDRAEAARAVVEREGLTVVTPDSGVIRPHPACSIEAEARREFRIAWRTLGLVDSSGPTEG